MNQTNNNLVFKVEISTEGQQQLLQYSKAFDDLRNSISGLSKPILELSDNTRRLGQNLTDLTRNTSQITAQNQAISNSSVKLKDAIKDISDVFNILIPVIDAVNDGLVTVKETMTTGIAVLVVMAPKILECAKALFKGKEAFDNAKKTLCKSFERFDTIY